MQATLDASSLKHLMRALTCISKFGDDLTLVATASQLVLSTTNSSMSAYCRFKFDQQFFSRYRVEPERNPEPARDLDDDIRLTGQLLVKSMLSILKHRTVEKSVDRCELFIADGALSTPAHGADQAGGSASTTDQDSLESKLTVRLHCKHGVVKTHKLLLLNANLLAAPSVPDALNESRLTVSPRAVRDMLEHFPLAKGPKSDPQLVWSFADEEVYMKGLDSSLDANVKGQLSTEATISAAEFEVYDIYDPPVTIAFHLREFLATVSFAEACALSLDLRFTNPANPLFIDVDGDLIETLFVIGTSQVASFRARGTPQPRGQKRRLEQGQDADDPEAGGWRERSVSGVPTSARKVKPMKAAVRVDRASVARELRGAAAGGSRAVSASVRGSMPPPSLGFTPLPSLSFPRDAAAAVPAHESQPVCASMFPPPPPPPPPREPLFLPGSQLSLSQPLSQSAEAAIRESGLGIEDMDADEFLNMLEGEGEEVNFVPASQTQEMEMDVSMTEAELTGGRSYTELDDFNIFDGEGETQLGPTQEDASGTRNNDKSISKVFHPLFDD